MDSLGTWPRPVSADERGFDVQVLKRLRTAPDGDGGGPGRASLGERVGTSMLLVLPVLAALAAVLLWMQWSSSGSVLFLVLAVGVLVGTALWWTTRAARAIRTAQGRLGSRLGHVVDQGVGVVRELELEPSPGDGGTAPEGGGRVHARLHLSVNPVRGPRFSTVVDAVYDADGARRLEVGSHGPVRFLRDDPEGTTVIDTRLSEEQVQQIYRGAALN